MRNLNFKYMSAKNFMCFGPKGIEINFEKLDKINLIQGENLDYLSDNEDDPKTSSNGAGKSSIPSILVWGLYGKTIKKPKKLNVDDVVNNKVGKGTQVEIIWDKYRIIRKRSKTSKLQLWESEEGVWNKDTEITRGSIAATQEEISNILGLNYESFINIVVFTDDNTHSFLESDAAGRRNIVDNIFSLYQYRERADRAKEKVKQIKEEIRRSSGELEILLAQEGNLQARINQIKQQEVGWKSGIVNEIKKIISLIDLKKKELKSSDTGEELLLYQEAQEKIKEINGVIKNKEDTQQKLEKVINSLEEKLSLVKEKHFDLKSEAGREKLELDKGAAVIKEAKIVVEKLQNNEGADCSECYAPITKGSVNKYLVKQKEKVIEARDKVKSKRLLLEELSNKLKKAESTIGEFTATKKDYEERARKTAQELKSLRESLFSYSQVKEPKADSRDLLLEQEIRELKNNALKKKEEVNGNSPYLSILKSTEDNYSDIKILIESKKEEIKARESDLPYYVFWQKGYGDKGIRRFIIDRIKPALNSRIDYWLQFLIDNKVVLRFDSELEELIERNPADGDPFVYHAMSGGERRRLNLAVSQAFAHVMEVNTSSSPSLVFLDEVAINIDQAGVQGIYNMIHELSLEKQVFVTTHNQELLRMLKGCKTINLQKKDGFARIVQE